MEKRKMYYGLDLLKFALAILVAARHMIQVFYAAGCQIWPCRYFLLSQDFSCFVRCRSARQGPKGAGHWNCPRERGSREEAAEGAQQTVGKRKTADWQKARQQAPGEEAAG